MLISRVKKFFCFYHKYETPSLFENKHYLGILLTALGWLLIWFTTPATLSPSVSLSFFNVCFYQHLIAFMALGLWIALKGQIYPFSKNPGGIFCNSLCVVLCYVVYFALKLSPSGMPIAMTDSFFLKFDGILIALIGALFLKQKIPKSVWLGLCIVIIGLNIFSNVEWKSLIHTHPQEIIYSFASSLVFSLLVISTNYLIQNGNPPLIICLYNTLFGFLSFGLLSLPEGISIPLYGDLLYVIISGLLYAVAIVLFTSAHRYTAFYYILPIHYIVPVYTFISDICLQQKMPLSQHVNYGVLILLVGLMITLRKKESKSQSSSILTPNPVDSAA